MPEPTVAVLLAEASHALARVSDSSRLDSEVLLAAALGKQRSYLYAWPEHEPNRRTVEAFEGLVRSRLQGRPVAYLVGRKEFWSLTLYVTAATLIPRPETELLVEQALPHIPSQGKPTVVDLGTGSGAVALALASERANATMIGVDISPAALAVARQNARVLRLDNLRLTVSNWFAALAPTLRACAIVANPPYVAAKDPHLVSGDPRFEPRTALVAGEDGLRDLAVIIAAAPNYLKARGNLLLEHGHNHGPRVRQMMRERGFQQVTTYQDTSSHERVTRGEHRG